MAEMGTAMEGVVVSGHQPYVKVVAQEEVLSSSCHQWTAERWMSSALELHSEEVAVVP